MGDIAGRYRRPKPEGGVRANGVGTVLLGVLLLCCAAMPAGAWQLRPVWPAPAELDAIAGESVSFPSRSPFVPAELAKAPATTAIGTLYRPADEPRRGVAPNAKVPAVVLLHGAAGILPAREHVYGRQLAAMGVMALVVDVFGARRDRGTGFVERLLAITETMAVADAYAALRFLAARPEVDASRVALVGFSYGGMATMYALNAGVAARLAPGGERFVAHAAFYGPCIAQFAEPRTTGAPLLMLYGGADTLIVPERCAAAATEFRAGGSAVEVKVYPDAVHQWDGGQPWRKVGRLLGGCRFRLDADGTVHDERLGMGMSGAISRRLILFNCTEDTPYWTGADEAVRAQSNRDLAAFLQRAFTGGRRGGG